MSSFAADLIRTVFVIIPGSLLFFSVAAVMVTYFRALYEDRLVAKINGHKVYGLLPKHVSTVAFTVMVYSFITVMDAATRLNEPLTWRASFYSLANITGCYSMVQVLKFERRRYRSAHV